MSSGKGCWAYIVSDRYRGRIYTDITTDIAARLAQHREGTGSAFVAKYSFKRLVFIERRQDIVEAIASEKAIKKWRRAWKITLIELVNPDWDDLYENLHG